MIRVVTNLCADDKRIVDSLFIVNWTGSLIEYLLEPHAKPGDKVTDECPIAMTASARAQWPLGRYDTCSQSYIRIICMHPVQFQ